MSTSSDVLRDPDPPVDATRLMHNGATVITDVEHNVWRAQLMVSLITIISLSIGKFRLRVDIDPEHGSFG